MRHYLQQLTIGFSIPLKFQLHKCLRQPDDLRFEAGKLGSELLSESTEQLSTLYPQVEQIANEKVVRVDGQYPNFTVVTNKASYQTKMIVVAINASNTFAIEGLLNKAS